MTDVQWRGVFPALTTKFTASDEIDWAAMERHLEFLQPAIVTLLTERRINSPWGLAGGEDGKVGENLLNGQLLAPKVEITVKAGDQLCIKTPGGGGWGVGEAST